MHQSACNIYCYAVAARIRNLHICFCSFELSCPILEKDNFIENVFIALSCLIKQRSFFNLVCFNLF